MKEVLRKLFMPKWSKWTLLHIYNFSLTNRSIEVRQNLDNGKVQFRVKRVANPVHGNYFSAEEVKKALSQLISNS